MFGYTLIKTSELNELKKTIYDKIRDSINSEHTEEQVKEFYYNLYTKKESDFKILPEYHNMMIEKILKKLMI